MHAAIAFSDVHSFRSHPCSAGCLCVSIRHIAIAQRWRRRPVLHWVAPPPPSPKFRVWVRGLNPSPQVINSLLPVQNRGWEEMVAEGKMFRALWVVVGEQLCVRGVSRDVSQAENVLFSWFDRAQKDDISILFWISVILHTTSNLSVHSHLLKRPPLLFYASTLFSATLVTEQGHRYNIQRLALNVVSWCLMCIKKSLIKVWG